MHKEFAAFGALLLAFCAQELTASAQTAGGPPAELMAVKKGVFTLKQGQSMDLTDRGILLSFRSINVGPDGNVRGVVFTINGGGGGEFSIGSRRDLKGEMNTREFVKDLRMCFVDLVSAVAPRGAAPSATFRLLCQ